MKFSQPVPILRMLDESKAREFYIDFLGFRLDWEHRFEDKAPLYMQVSRDGCVIHLSEHYGDSTPGGALRITIDDVDGLNRELLDKQYKYAKPGVSETLWRTKEMTLKDPFGNRLVFSQPMPMGATNVDMSGIKDGEMTPVGLTARWVAASRALETEDTDPLYRDPFARELAGEPGFAMLSAMRKAMGAPETASADIYLTLRTKVLDDGVLSAVRDSGIVQVVILAAGMDARAFRLDWPAGVTLFEVDRDDVFDYKEPIIERSRITPRCDRRVVRIDLSKSLTDPIVKAGFDPTRPAAFLIEGLLMYLDEATATGLFEALRSIAVPGSWLGFDAVNSEMLTSTYTANYMKLLADFGSPWHFGLDDAEAFIARYGWKGSVVYPGEPEAHFGRWKFPVMPRNMPGIPRAYFVQARLEPA